MIDVSIVGAFIAGLVSFLAPCVLPIIPGFMAYLGGSTVADSANKRRDIFINSFFFVLGFSVVFATLGALLNSVLEAVAYDAQIWLARIGGAIIIFFGLYLLGLIKIPFLEREYKPTVNTSIKARWVVSFLFGLAFAVGWTPCVGPALGVIFGLAASNPGSAFYLLLAYALGLGAPFLLIGLFTAQAAQFISRHSRGIQITYKIFGVILIALGVLVFTRTLNLIANFEFLNRFILPPV